MGQFQRLAGWLIGLAIVFVLIGLALFLLVSTEAGENLVKGNRLGLSEADLGVLSGFAFACTVLVFAFAAVVRNAGSGRVRTSGFDKELERAAREMRMDRRSDDGGGG